MSRDPHRARPPWPEFPPGVDRPPDGPTRRSLMQWLAASAALAGLGGCVRGPDEPVYPYPRRTPGVVPGVPLHFATSMVLDGLATGLLVESREGRPVKIEGNPEHPASLGAAGVFEQASLLDLYGPGRADGVTRHGTSLSWEALRKHFAPGGDGERDDGGEGVALLLEPTGSPLRAQLLGDLRRRWPRASVHFHAPLAAHASFEATRALCGRALAPQPDLARAERIVAVGADFLASGPFHLRHARQFARRRRPRPDLSAAGGVRLYVAEATPTPTGSMAEHRLPIRDGEAVALLRALAEATGALPAGPGGEAAPLPERQRRWVDAAARDLEAHRGSALVLAGEHLPPAAQGLALAIDRHLGAFGETLRFVAAPLLAAGEPGASLAALVAKLEAGAIDTLFVLGGNPAYASAGETEFTAALARVRDALYLGPQTDETAAACRWFVAESHYLESWGDARAWDGTLSLVQPLVRPFGDTHTADELLALLAGRDTTDAHALLRSHWRDSGRLADESGWQRTLARGVVEGSTSPELRPELDLSPLAGWLADDARAAARHESAAIELDFRGSPALHDGRFAANGWLQELPDPVTKLTWGNAVLLSPRTARRLGVEAGQRLTLGTGDDALTAPALPVPGHADDSLTLRLGYGRRAPGEIAGVGFDAYRLLPAGGFVGVATGVEVSPEHEPLASTQHHWRMEGREIALAMPRERFLSDPGIAARKRETPHALYEPPENARRPQWGMAIDLSVCTGCSACVVACQAENNVPVVGFEGVRDGREMHWLRIDRYLEGPEEDPRVVHQPMLCQHCEAAPCEYVCPVNATVHSDDGLNEMIYNRCVGTRFCSNNCPYKVRRFNWFDYNAGTPPRQALVFNPEVTVRERGVMEKCTYCVQRIRTAEIRAVREGRELAEGDVVTACQQACPTEAIDFGDIDDGAARVARSWRDARAYAVLHDLGTRPRTRYQVRLDDPNPELEPERSEPEEGRA